MSRASVSDLKARLSHFLREVARGGEVEILDRGVPVARLSGPGKADVDAGDGRRQRLIRAGVLRQRTSKATALADLEPIQLSTSILEALQEERADRL